MAEYIEREAAKRCVNEHYDDAIIMALDAIPAADVAPVRRGRFTRHILKDANVPWGCDCSACGKWFVIGEDTANGYNYCPNCGAKMEVEE